jgi:hypothetical protein
MRLPNYSGIIDDVFDCKVNHHWKVIKIINLHCNVNYSCQMSRRQLKMKFKKSFFLNAKRRAKKWHYLLENIMDIHHL